MANDSTGKRYAASVVKAGRRRMSRSGPHDVVGSPRPETALEINSTDARPATRTTAPTAIRARCGWFRIQLVPRTATGAAMANSRTLAPTMPNAMHRASPTGRPFWIQIAPQSNDGVVIGMAGRLQGGVTELIGPGGITGGFGRGDVAIILLFNEEAGAIPALLPVLLGKRAVKAVGAALGHYGYGSAAGVTDGSVEVSGFDFEFLDGGGVRKIGRAVAVAHVRDAVDGPVIPADIAGIVRFAGSPDGVDAVVAAIGAGLDAGDELNQHERTVVERGEIEDAAIFHDAAGADAAGLEQRGFGGDGNSLRRFANREQNIDFRAGAD